MKGGVSAGSTQVTPMTQLMSQFMSCGHEVPWTGLWRRRVSPHSLLPLLPLRNAGDYGYFHGKKRTQEELDNNLDSNPSIIS